eukprot:6200207-Pleurochrysis_carterae.AAC.1
MKVTYTAILVWQTRQIAPLKKPTAFPDESVSASHGTGSDKKKVAPAALHPATDLKPKIDSIVKQSSFSKKTTPADFQFKNCTFTVMVKKKGEKGKVPRKLLDDLSGTVEAGSVLAIMGPSGARRERRHPPITLPRPSPLASCCSRAVSHQNSEAHPLRRAGGTGGCRREGSLSYATRRRATAQ